MKRKLLLLSLGFVIVSIIFSACNPSSTPPPAGITKATKNPNDNRSETAFQALPVALAYAKANWNKDAELYEIPALRMMEKNLGYPPSLPGWFYMFQVPNSPLEYYIEVQDNQVAGHTEAQPVVIGQRAFTRQPIGDTQKLLDSDAVLELYLQSGGKEYLASHPKAEIDYRLDFIKGTDHPVWSIYDVSDMTQPPLVNYDAVTGKVTDDPIAKAINK
jgi:hypothetical protein